MKIGSFDTDESYNLIFILGASGSGKTVLANNLVKAYPRSFDKFVQYTTRPMREGERQNIDYHFVSKDVMEEDVMKRDSMIAVVRNQFDNVYGTDLAESKDGKYGIVVVSIEGFVDALEKMRELSKQGIDFYADVIFIDTTDSEDDVFAREGRDAETEAIYTKAIIKAIERHSENKECVHLKDSDANKYSFDFGNIYEVRYDSFVLWREDMGKVVDMVFSSCPMVARLIKSFK